MKITQVQARRFLLAHQGLWPPHGFQGKAGILEFIRRVNCIQFDPLNIAGQNPDLVLQARLSDYQPAMLSELLYQDRKLLDGYDKVMSIYPLEDRPYFERTRDTERRSNNSPAAIKSILPHMRAIIEARGPISSLDLDFKEPIDWSWAPTSLGRAALESMYLWGELTVHHKVNTRKMYDFSHRHLPGDLLAAPDPNETQEDYHDWFVHRRVGGVGLFWRRSSDAWLSVPRVKSTERQAAFDRLLAQGRLVEIQVDGLSSPFYVRDQDMPNLKNTLQVGNPPPQAVIMAPLDNLLWDRTLVKELFGLDYRWEVYVPAGKRRYGYYVLPILYGDRFIARLEPGREKRNSHSSANGRGFIIKNWWWEPDFEPGPEVKTALRDCLERFLHYLGTERLIIEGPARENGDLDWL